MNFYDEEITIGSNDNKPLSSIKIDRLPSGGAPAGYSVGRGSGRNTGASEAMMEASGSRGTKNRQNMNHSSTDDDGLLDIIHDDEDDDDISNDDSDMQMPNTANMQPSLPRSSTQMRPQTRPGSSRNLVLPTAKALDESASETDSDEPFRQHKLSKAVGPLTGHASTDETQLSITPDKWEALALSEEIKEMFPYILKYTPQNIDTPYHLQPFIPEYVPAVGDVDAFLKVGAPMLPQPLRQLEINDHLQKMGLYYLDEPSGEQSEPSLLNMKLRSVLTGSGVNPRSASAALIPTAKSNKDIDKWVAEVEQVHMTQSVFDAQPRKDIEALIMDWPQEYANATAGIQEAYQKCLQNNITLTEYIGVLCERFEVEGPLDTQVDYLLGVQTLFALYLAANQAWEY